MPVLASKALLVASLAFTAGIFFAQFLSFSFLPSILLGQGVVFLTLFKKEKQLFLLGLFVLFVGLGMLRFLSVESESPREAEPKRAEFEAVIIKDPEPDERYTKLVVAPQNKDISDLPAQAGRVLVFAEPFAEFGRGDKIFVTGELATPPVFEDFDYRSFLAKDGVFWTMNRPSIIVLKAGNSVLERVRQRFRSSIEQHFSSPESFVLASMLLGDKSRLPDDFKTQLNKTGTRHITAISGMHVSIFASIFGTLLVMIGVLRKRAVLITILFVVLFVAFTGFQTSALRAGIMGGTGLAGGMFGRPKHSLRLLVIAAVFMLALNPLLLRYDVGFQLSFLAVLGILVFAPLVKDRLPRFGSSLGVWDIVAMTISAQLFTLPVLLGTFDSFSLVAILTNVLVVSVLPFVLGFGLLFLILAQILPFLGGILSFPVAVLLSFAVFVIKAFSVFPGAAVQTSGDFWWLLFFLLTPLAYFAWKTRLNKKFPFRPV